MIVEKIAIAALVTSLVLATLISCQQQEGPAEEAGKEVDKAAAKLGEQIENAGESVQNATEGEKK
jgi:hypothetical protein